MPSFDPSLELVPPASCPVCRRRVETNRCTRCGVAIRAGRYRVLDVVSQGPHRRVYLAADEQNERFALKELRYETDPAPAVVSAFRNQSERMSGLELPGVPHFVERFTEGAGRAQRDYHVEGWAAGTPLTKRLAAGPLSGEQTVDLAQQLLAILAGLHERKPNLVHGAVRPENLLLDSASALTLIDFQEAIADGDERPDLRGAAETLLVAHDGSAGPGQRRPLPRRLRTGLKVLVSPDRGAGPLRAREALRHVAGTRGGSGHEVTVVVRLLQAVLDTVLLPLALFGELDEDQRKETLRQIVSVLMLVFVFLIALLFFGRHLMLKRG